MSKIFDVRTIEHKLRRGDVTKADYQAYLASLPDESEEAAESETRFTATYAARYEEPPPTSEDDA